MFICINYTLLYIVYIYIYILQLCIYSKIEDPYPTKNIVRRQILGQTTETKSQLTMLSVKK